MIRFIDVNTGNVYNGSTPYVHWFEGKQSVGLNYDKRFIILSDKQEIDIQLNSEVFYLVDPSKLLDENKVSKYDKEYYNLKNIKTDNLHSTGVPYDSYFIHSFNIIAQGNYVGEVLDDLYIDNEHFVLGADFYDENESLGINLANFGAEISNEVQRAIYEKNIDEQKVDFVLMNRKFKELLNEYINVLGNKGSYKSLVNALKWFEYGELTKIYEFWKRPEPNKNYLTIKDLSSIANTRTEELLLSNSKTTFIGIGCALNKIKTVDGEIVYENSIDESEIFEEPTFWGYSPLQYEGEGGFFANMQWCTIYNKDKTVTFRLAVDREITGFAPQISFEGNYVGMEYNNGYYEYTTPEKYEYGTILPEVWFFWLASYYGVIRVDIPYKTIGSKNNRDDVVLPAGWNWVISGGKNNILSLVDEPNPVLEDNALLWSKEDMSLKMSLLGNFFATYFMPIHLDLLFSTIEKTIYTDTIKLVSFPKLSRFDYIDDLSGFICNIEKTYYLSNVETYTYPDTIFGFENNLSKKINYRDEHLEILGVECNAPELYEGMSEEEIIEYGKAYNLQHYKGIGVVVPFKCELSMLPSDAITKASIKVFRAYYNEEEHINEESLLERDRYDIKYTQEGNKAYVNFNLLMRNIGDYKVQLSFRRSDGFEYIKTLKYSVSDENYPELTMYKLVPKEQTFLDNFEINSWFPETENSTSIELGNIADYVLNPVQQSILDDVIYTQFISSTNKNIASVHTNQVFIIKTDENTDLSKIVFHKKGLATKMSLLSLFINFIGEDKGDCVRFYKSQLTNDFVQDFENQDLSYIDYYYSTNIVSIYNSQEIKITEITLSIHDLSLIVIQPAITDIVANGRSKIQYTNNINGNKYITGYMSDVYWITMNRFGEIITTNEIPEIDTKSENIVEFSGSQIKYFIGIKTTFNKENSKRYSIEKSEITSKGGTRIWIKDMFIPYFFKLEEFGTTSLFDYVALGLNDEDVFKRRNSENTYKIKAEDVVCFLPNIKCVKRPTKFMWKYKNVTLNDEIIPQTFRRFDMKVENGKIIPNDNRNTDKYPFPTILQPLFGRYDFGKIVYPGYYDITLNYKLNEGTNNITKTISSQFIVEKDNTDKLYSTINDIIHKRNVNIQNKTVVEILTGVLSKINIGGFSDGYILEQSKENNISKDTLLELLNDIFEKVYEEGYDLDFLIK